MKQKNIRVDVAGICSIIHTCDGCVNASRRCCSWYEVTLTGREVRCIDGCIPLAAQYSPTLKSPDGYENVFEQTSRDHYSIDTTEDGVCAFAYFKGTRILCSLHSAAIKERIPFDQAKPQSCLLWPLAISDGMTPTLSVQDDAFEFHCNARSEEVLFSLSPSIAMNIEWAFGREFLNKVQGAVDRQEPWITIRP